MVNKLEYMLPWAHPSTHPKRHLDRSSHLCRANYWSWRQNSRHRCGM